jgi:hypothetical protein
MQASTAGVGGVAGSLLQSGGSGAGEYGRFLPQAADTPATSATPNPNPNRAQRPAPGTTIPAWADRPLYAETARPLWDTGEAGKQKGAENRSRRVDPIPPGQRLATGIDRRLWNPGESAKPGGDDKDDRQANAPPTDPTRAYSIDPPLWNDGSSVARSPAPCERSEAAAPAGTVGSSASRP